MNKISKIAVAAALTAASVSANAWVGWGPFDGFGDGWGDGHFSMSMGGGAGSRFHGYGYDAPYWAHPYGYAPVVAPVADSEEARKAIEEQQKVFAEQQAEAYKQAVEAQRAIAEQYAGQQPMVTDPLFTAHNDLMKRIADDQMDAHQRFAGAQQDMAQRIAEDQTRFWGDVRDMHTGSFAPVSFEERVKQAEARRADAMKDAEERRAETMKMIEEQRVSARRGYHPNI